MIEPKEIQIDGQTFIISKFPAVQGREIVAKYPVSNLPKLGDYQVSEETMMKLMAFVAVNVNEKKQIQLTTRALIDNHVKSWETLAKIEMAMLNYNCSFFQDGTASDFLGGIAQSFIKKVTEILTPSSAVSSAPEKPLFTNSEQSTH